MKWMEFDGPGEMSPEKDCQVTVGNSNCQNRLDGMGFISSKFQW